MLMVAAVSREAAAMRVERSRRFCLLLPLVALALIGQMGGGFGQATASEIEDRRARKSSPAVAHQGLVGKEEPAGDFDASACTIFQGTTIYKQENAPTDASGVIGSIYDRMNEDLDDVVKLEINYVGGVIHRIVGKHDVRATVTRRGETGEDTVECMVMPVVIEDSDECSLPEGHSMRHECDPSAECVNTIGSYECSCPQGEACVPWSGAGFCQNVTSSANCCTVDEEQRPSGCRDKTCASDCRRDFRCYTDQCEGKCFYPDSCKSSRGSVTCRCGKGEVGNGQVCPGEMPVLYTDAQGQMLPADLDLASVCGCQVPEVDLCHGVICGQHSSCNVMDGKVKCACSSGFGEVPGHGCVDENAPSLVLKGPAQVTMKQCDKYVERGVEVIDANSENDDRNVGVTFSKPPGRCTAEMGSFTVTYTLNTGWTDPPFQSIVRHVTVEDVDECLLDPFSAEAACPGCLPQCHRHADCQNRVGTYACECPACMSGDGFIPFVQRKSGRIPAGYEGGTGCRDVCPPVITLMGDDPLKLTLGVNTDMSGKAIKGKDYTDDLAELIARTSGEGLCNGDSSYSRCAMVIDNNGTHQGVDITDRLKILTPIQVSKYPLQWQVTYEAVDEAGNYAEPKVRTIEIQELTMEDYADRKVKEALKNRPCPACPKCPSCAKQQQQQQQQPAKQLPCKPDGRGGGGGSCKDCPCSSREGCMEKSVCEGLGGGGAGGGGGRSCPADGGEERGRGGRWCLPILLSGAQQIAIAVCVTLATAIVLVAANR